jgi:protein SCO1/2
MKFPRFLKSLGLVLSSVVLLAACQKDAVKFNSTDLTGLDFAKAFTLTDHHGQVKRLADYQGKAVFVFFGYTQCPDVCPTTMTDMAQVMKLLGKDADKLQVIFITVDPERDTKELLSQYVPQFDARFIGMYASLEETKKVATDFKVFFTKVPNKDGTSYSIDHTAAAYIYDPQGRVRLFVRHGEKPELIAQDIQQLLR